MPAHDIIDNRKENLVHHINRILASTESARNAGVGSFGDDAVRADGVGDDHIVVNDEQDAVAAGDVEVEDLMAVPKQAFEFVNVQRGMPPVVAEQAKLGAGGSLDLQGGASAVRV